MISYAEALRIIEVEGAKRRGHLRSECLPILECIGRHSSKDIDSLDNNPRFDNSAMDGFAVVASETIVASASSPLRLLVTGCLAAGDMLPPDATKTKDRTCIEIMTGAKIPESPYDTVVRLEDVEEECDQSGQLVAVSLRAPVKTGENIRREGDDIRTGDRLFSKGTGIGPQHLLALSMVGYSTLDVFERPRIVVLSTGNEIVPFDSPEISAQQIRNSAAPLLCSVLKLYGADVFFHGIVRDNPEEIRRALLEALEKKPDLIVSTGGVSIGKFDFVKSVLEECGAEIHFHKVAVRPGKPILFGGFASKGPAFFGLPGNPIAVAAATRFFVRPYLGALYGENREVPHLLPLSQEIRKPEGLSFFQRAIRDAQGVRVLPGQASFMAASFLKAEGWVVGAAKAAVLKQGELVEWYTLW